MTTFQTQWEEAEKEIAEAGGLPWKLDFAVHWKRWEAVKGAMGARFSLLRVPRARQCADADLCFGVTVGGACACYADNTTGVEVVPDGRGNSTEDEGNARKKQGESNPKIVLGGRSSREGDYATSSVSGSLATA